MPKMSSFLNENHRSSVTLTLLNVLGVMGVLNVLNVLNMPMDASLACLALFLSGTSYKVALVKCLLALGDTKLKQLYSRCTFA